MNKEEIVKALKEKIQLNKEEWATMWIVKESQLLKGEEAEKAEIAKAELSMTRCNERLGVLNTLLKRCESLA